MYVIPDHSLQMYVIKISSIVDKAIRTKVPYFRTFEEIQRFLKLPKKKRKSPKKNPRWKQANPKDQFVSICNVLEGLLDNLAEKHEFSFDNFEKSLNDMTVLCKGWMKEEW